MDFVFATTCFFCFGGAERRSRRFPVQLPAPTVADVTNWPMYLYFVPLSPAYEEAPIITLTF